MRTAARAAWVDRARGIGIILVVFGHAWRGIETAGLAIPDRLYEAVDRAIYAFHMPFFFLLSGMFLERAVGRHDPRAFVADRALRLIWPLFLWTWAFFAVKLLAGSHQNTPLMAADFPFFPLPPRLHFWFLWALFLIQLALGLAAMAAGPLGRTTGFWLAVLALTLAGAVRLEIPEPLLPWLAEALANAPYLVVGVLLARAPRLPVHPAWGVFAGLVFAATIGFALSGAMTRAETPAFTILAIVALAAAIHVAEAANARFRAAGWLAHLGRVSMAIYLAHTIFSAALRSLLLGVGVENVWILLAGEVAVGLAGPAALDAAARRAGMARILGF